MKGNTMKTNNISITLIMAAALLAFAPLGVQAAEIPAKGEMKSHHEGRPPAAGEIVKLTADSIEIKDHKGITETFIITADTKYGTKEKPAKPEDFKEGEHVLVSYTKAGDKMTPLSSANCRLTTTIDTHPNELFKWRLDSVNRLELYPPGLNWYGSWLKPVPTARLRRF